VAPNSPIKVITFFLFISLFIDLIHAMLLFMETAVTIDAELLDRAMLFAGGQTQRQLVEDALRFFTLRGKQGEARKYRGKLQWEGNLDEMRAAKWS